MGGTGIFVKGHLWDMPGGAYEGRGGGGQSISSISQIPDLIIIRSWL